MVFYGLPPDDFRKDFRLPDYNKAGSFIMQYGGRKIQKIIRSAKVQQESAFLSGVL